MGNECMLSETMNSELVWTGWDGMEYQTDRQTKTRPHEGGRLQKIIRSDDRTSEHETEPPPLPDSNGGIPGRECTHAAMKEWEGGAKKDRQHRQRGRPAGGGCEGERASEIPARVLGLEMTRKKSFWTFLDQKISQKLTESPPNPTQSKKKKRVLPRQAKCGAKGRGGGRGGHGREESINWIILSRENSNKVNYLGAGGEWSDFMPLVTAVCTLMDFIYSELHKVKQVKNPFLPPPCTISVY